MARRAGIGSSDIATLLGLSNSRYASPYTLWADKLQPHDDEESTDGPAYWGRRLEAPIAEDFARRNQVNIRQAGMWQSGELDVALANPDRFVLISGEKPEALVEVKTASAYFSREWNGERPEVDDEDLQVPEGYIVQLQWQLGVLGLPYGWIAGLVGGQWYHQVRFDFDATLFADLLALADDFWSRHVATGIPPEIDGSDATTKLLKSVRATEGETALLDPAVVEPLLDERAQAKAAVAEAEAWAKRIDNQLRVLIGTAETAVAVGDGRTLFTYKQSNKKAYTVREQTSRRMYVPRARKVAA